MQNELVRIVKESGLEETKAQIILSKFQDYFELAAQWELKAKSLVVTNANQKAEMEMARTGRLFLREKRINIENVRKELKEQALREGKTIDGIANVLKGLIVPIEEYLDKQEHFVEHLKEIEEAKIRIEIEARMESERIAAEKAKAEEQERLRLENEKLKAEAIEREKKAKTEKAKQDKIISEQKAAADKERRIAEEKARIERNKQAEILAKQQAESKQIQLAIEKKAADDRQIAEAKQKQLQAKMAAEKAERQRLAEVLANQIECPFCHNKFNIQKER